MTINSIARTALVAASAVVLGAGLGLVAPANAQPLETIVSDSWHPGFTKDDGGKYVRLVPASETGTARTELRVEQSDTWQPGFSASDDGYVRLVTEQSTPHSPAQVAEISSTWSPGAVKDEDQYIRFVDAD